MREYNFDNLSPYDFELLIRDLIQSVEGIKLRSFAPGRDRGIDLRGWETENPPHAVIVQCKHMAHSSWAAIKASIEKERLKLDRLEEEPSRYILAVTKPLTVQNVDELFQILRPYCRTPDDILDVAAVEQFLDSNDTVVRKHYKLWITSTTILQRILYAGIYNRSESYREDLLRKSRTFVQPDAFARAQRGLKENHSCIISGPPGVGKTTLAEMLCLEYLAQDFELIVISEDMREGDSVYAAGKRQVFIYDDFLGRTDVHEKLGKNEDNRIVEFIRRVYRSPTHRFVLTTREYILRAAQQIYDRLDTGDLDVLKCVIEMSSYTTLQKGLILYQHLAFAEHIASEGIEDLVRRRLYRQIVEHPNYTPRHITDALSDIERRRRGTPQISLAEDLLAVLNDPTYMWSHALRESSQDSQRLFLSLPLLPQPISVDDLQVAYSSERFNRSEPFLDSLRALEDSFISIDRGTQGRRWVVFRNPSLQDFSYEYLNNYSDWLDSLLSEPVFYEQIIRVYQIAMSPLPGVRKVSGGVPGRIILEEGPIKFPEVRSWVTRRHDYLIGKALSLALSGSEVVRQYVTEEMITKVQDLSEIILEFGEPSSQPTKQLLGELIDRAIKPAGASSATAIYSILQGGEADLFRGVAAGLIRRYSASDPMDVLRESILDKDTWKFYMLFLIDQALGIDPETSMTQWGNDYLVHVEGLVSELLQSDDYDRLDDAINELEDISSFLDVDLDDSISSLEYWRDHLPSEETEMDYEGYASGKSPSGRSKSDSMRELDNVFGSLMELFIADPSA
jgi:hypothetical protein